MSRGGDEFFIRIFSERKNQGGGKRVDVEDDPSYLTPANDVSLHRQHVHDFSLALVAPLRAEDHRDLGYKTAGHPLFLPRRARATVAVRLLHPPRKRRRLPL